MISTVTTSTVSTMTTAVMAGSAALIGVLVLLVLLIQKEITTSSHREEFKKLRKVMNIGMIPLSIVFWLAAAVRFIDVLQ